MMQKIMGGVNGYGTTEHYEWLLDWCAYVLQNIGIKRPKTAVFLQGGQGTGKGTFAKLFGKIFGVNHYVAISKPKQLTGEFNWLLM
ncbi:MAG: hypothetical protein GY757_26280, partial [bacterium]|nr:hypothetical protein [bacterium]